jgi:hypothetical protein
MNFADLSTTPLASGPHAFAPLNTMPTLGDVVARIGAEVAMPLTQALERVATLGSLGRIDGAGLRALHAEIENARRVGMRSQQIARLTRGDVHQLVERLDLNKVLRQALDTTAAQAEAQAARLISAGALAEVMGDASLINALLCTAIDWCNAHAKASPSWQITMQAQPARACVVCQFAHGEPTTELHTPPNHLHVLNNLDWLLLQYTAHMAGVVVHRFDDAHQSKLKLEFLHTVNNTLAGASTTELGQGSESKTQLAGCQVLVLAAKRDARQEVGAALLGHDLFIDYVPTLDAARDYCAEGAPQVLIYESAFESGALRQLATQLQAKSPATALIEVLPAGHSWEMGEADTSSGAACLGADALRDLLPSVMVLELARRR